jgi:geranylgeranyl diphosphate synthase type II
VNDPFKQYLRERGAMVDDSLDRFLPRPPACPPTLADAMRYSVFAGGKRFRPLLALATAEAVARHPDVIAARGSQPLDVLLDLALPAACAIEMIHTYSLIHDDLPAMDNDTLRRGRPTLHVVYGDAIAILAGDGLLTEAFALLGSQPAGNDGDLSARRLRAIGTVAVAAGVAGMVGGQVIDLEATGTGVKQAAVSSAAPSVARGGSAQVGTLERMHACKTGALIRASTVAGAIMAGADEPVIAAADRYATELGLAFQIVDDVLDVEGSTEDLGKTAGKDAAAGKLTYPALYGLDESRRLARACADRAHDVVSGSGLVQGFLDEIVEWVVARTK